MNTCNKTVKARPNITPNLLTVVAVLAAVAAATPFAFDQFVAGAILF